jgi:NAD(P)-dependent dehydrogenase (short-subunit alcohol dehydrogenase family)
MSGVLGGRRILVTGAARGIGRATVGLFLQEDAAVAAMDRDADALQDLAETFAGSRLRCVVADVTDDQILKTAIDREADAMAGIDGIVNAAGIDLVADIETMALHDWTRVLFVNLTGPMQVIKHAYPYLRAAGGGTIVNVSSGAGLLPLKHRTAYSASKAGLQMMSKSLAMEAAAFNIRVNCVCPGAVDTDLFRASLPESTDKEAALDAIRARYALNRIAAPYEIAAAILWLTGPASSYVTGTAMAVDGGRTFH